MPSSRTRCATGWPARPWTRRLIGRRGSVGGVDNRRELAYDAFRGVRGDEPVVAVGCTENGATFPASPSATTHKGGCVMSAEDRHWDDSSPGDRHRGGESGDRQLAASALARHGSVEAAVRRLRADADDPIDRARWGGRDALNGYVARRLRVAAAFEQGTYRACACGRLAHAPHAECHRCRAA